MKDYGFVWDMNALTERENQFLDALLDLHVMYVVLYRKQAEARVETSLQDVGDALALTCRWANEKFPGIEVTNRIATPKRA